MTGIKATPRHNISTQAMFDYYSMLRGLATSIDGFKAIKGKTNARLARVGHSTFRFRTQAGANRFLRRGEKRLGDVFRFSRMR
ncbi:hypothetical protein QIF44_13380 [Stenotrophomonas indicatrix]|uniref:hypothetical protein n=1 Tax=Stenotrophomonas indicatrix TaxID=2045451 RepID=UPI00249AA91E|nr:hypothetical protein [Stenotrophomonas indicatrix]WGV53299.1 hypothetical protein QIF44_13380 [Stenotrophomonas indicatrix]